MTAHGPVVAAGAVVIRKSREQVDVLLIHRPKYDDWSFPKGKLDTDEDVGVAAVREVAEETGLDIRLGPPLSRQQYTVGDGKGQPKQVHYWLGRVVGDDDVATFVRNDEVDEVRWVPLDKAVRRLTYKHDRRTLGEAESLNKRSYPLLVLRHTKARSRKSWRDDDRERPLNPLGAIQAERLVPALSAYGVTKIVSSSSRRCLTTVAPYAEVAGIELELTDGLSEEDATPATVATEVERLLASSQPTVLCTHRPVLPLVFKALKMEPPALEVGGFVAAHVRRRRVFSVEHRVPPVGR